MTQAAALSPHISLLALGQGPKPFLMCHGFTGPSPVGCCSVLVLVALSEHRSFWCVPGNIPGVHPRAAVRGPGFK